VHSSKTKLWVTLITSGLGVAALTFVGDKAWQVLQHRSIGPKYVDATIQVETTGSSSFCATKATSRST